MKDVNLARIYLHLVKFYGVKRFEVFSDLDTQWLSPKETMIEFFYDIRKEINHTRLNRILARDIRNVASYFVMVRNSKIIIYITYFEKKGILDFDLEFSKN